MNSLNLDGVFSILLPTLSNATLISRHSTRLGGYLLHYDSPVYGEIFVKYGLEQARREIIRENQTIQAIARRVATPTIVFFYDDGTEALIATQAVQGEPLHIAVKSLGRDLALKELATVIESLWNLPPDVLEDLPVGVKIEIQDIHRLLDENRIDHSRFRRMAGSTPEKLLEIIEAEISSREHTVLSHGDLCLPNVLVGRGEHPPVLIDWGKAGRGHRSRDMASLHFSLDRNLDPTAFYRLAEMIGYDWQSEEILLNLYRTLDFYWYSVIPGSKEPSRPAMEGPDR